MDEILRCAKERFGIEYLFPYQRLVIANIVEALRDTDGDGATRGRQIVILPTGAGKSLCFQLPAALVRSVTLIIYPLLSLMNDQERRMREGGFSVVQLRDGQGRTERERVLAEIAAGAVDFVLTNPETLSSDALALRLKRSPIAHAVVDEAHCVSEWGDTGPEHSRADGYLPIWSPGATLPRPAVIFCRSRGATEAIAALLRPHVAAGRTMYYHAGLPREEKRETERRFFESRDGILAATCAYGIPYASYSSEFAT